MSSGRITAPRVIILSAYTFKCGCLIDGYARTTMLILVRRIRVFDCSAQSRESVWLARERRRIWSWCREAVLRPKVGFLVGGHSNDVFKVNIDGERRLKRSKEIKTTRPTFLYTVWFEMGVTSQEKVEPLRWRPAQHTPRYCNDRTMHHERP